jgi:hypothetical protein
MNAMTPTAADLSSMAATVDELTVRLGPIAGTYQAAHREDLVAEVHEVERALATARRRLNRLIAADRA